MPVSREAVAWGIRFLLGVEPSSDEELDFHRNGYESVDTLRTAFMRAPEAQALFKLANFVPSSHLGDFRIPPFLLRRPEFEEIAWRFEEPTISEPVSQLCTFEQMATPEYNTLCGRLKISPENVSRKMWEYTYILSVLERAGKIGQGLRGLGFAVGTEPLPSAFAAGGCLITATDAPLDNDVSQAWAATGQWASDLEKLWRPELVSRENFLERVHFLPVDMNAIPTDLRDFDFCWSNCSLEHLGSIRHGLDFIHNSIGTLKPGGVAVHTTEFNLDSNDHTLESPMLSLYRKQDIEQLIHELLSNGHQVAPLNLWPGITPVDEHIDLPPYSPVHLKLQVLKYTVTSVGLIIIKGK